MFLSLSLLYELHTTGEAQRIAPIQDTAGIKKIPPKVLTYKFARVEVCTYTQLLRGE